MSANQKGEMSTEIEEKGYLYDLLQSRNYEENSEDDVYAQLAQKEKDLMLAAELGKALLEKNEELTQMYKRLKKEHSEQVEVRKN